MKIKSIATAFMAVFSFTSVFAQSSVLSVGVGFPSGDFAGDEFDRNVILGEGKQGGAANGFNVGYKFLSPLSSPEFQWFFSADFFYNGLISDISDEIEDDLKDGKMPSYINIPVMAGLNYTIANINSDVSLYAEGGVGVNMRHIRKLEGTATDIYVSGYGTIDIDMEYSFDKAFLFAFQLGAGATIKDKFTIGLNYFNLGNEKVRYKISAEAEGYSDTEKGKSDKKLSANILALRVGFKF